MPPAISAVRTHPCTLSTRARIPRHAYPCTLIPGTRMRVSPRSAVPGGCGTRVTPWGSWRLSPPCSAPLSASAEPGMARPGGDLTGIAARQPKVDGQSCRCGGESLGKPSARRRSPLAGALPPRPRTCIIFPSLRSSLSLVQYGLTAPS